MKKPLIAVIAALLLNDVGPLLAQSVYVPLNRDYYWKLSRYEITQAANNPSFHTVQQPYLRKDVIRMVDSMEASKTHWSGRDRFNFSYLRNDSHEWSESDTEDSEKTFFKHFYQKKADLFYFQDSVWEVHVNPVLEFAGGRDFEQDESLYLNSRGVELRGSIDNKVGFYSYLTENQARFPSYARQIGDSTFALPHEGFWKDFKTNGHDFFSPRGYITFGLTPHIGLQFGYDRNFIGNGYRSLILSDYGNAYMFLKLNTRVWKLNYTNIFAEMNAFYSRKPQLTERFPKKYMALHHLSLNLGRNVNIGLSETVFFGSGDSLREPSFELHYLNPIIFYRAVEQQLGSPDNVTIALDFKWNFLRHFSLYGQLFLDEFLLEEVRAQRGWWANKYAFQLGAKYINAFGVKNLDLQAETNVVRPYTYSHKDVFRNYAHYNQSLAHPFGANFYEGIGIIRWQPLDRLELRFTGILAMKGEDLDQKVDPTRTVEDNNGGDIMKSYDTRNMEYGNELGQGVGTDLTYFDFQASFMVKHNLFIDFQQVLRNRDSNNPGFRQNANYTMITLRLNTAKRVWDF